MALRHHRISHFGHQAEEMKSEYDELMKTVSHEARHKATLEKTFNEWDDRELARARLQVEGPGDIERIGLPGKELGVFGIPMGNGDFHGLGTESGFREGIDELETHPFTSEPNTYYENAEINRMYVESEIGQNQDLYDSLKENCSALEVDIEKMCTMRDRLDRELSKVTKELTNLEKDQFGPPRRLPRPKEIGPTHDWKSRVTELQNKLADLQYTIDKADTNKRSAEAQALSIAQQIAVLKEKERSMKKSMDEVNGELGMLPMIVGKSLDKVRGMDETALPLETLQAITHKSRLVAIRKEAGDAKKIQQEADTIERNIWLQKQLEENKKMDLERVLNKLSDMSERLMKSKVENLRVNIIDSLKAFLLSDLQLNTVLRKLMGALAWYQHHDPDLSLNIRRYVSNNMMGELIFEKDKPNEDELKSNSNGVTLGNARTGYCCGTISMPKNSLWIVVVTITRQGTELQYDSQDPSDFVSVSLGPSIAGLGLVGTYFNKINPLTGTVIYDVKYIFRGNSFSFRFDFSSSSDDPKHHLAISTGLYEEYELNDLEYVDDPKIIGRQRVLSSFVKMLRIEEARGKLREARLLEELILLENSSSKIWDSLVISQYKQRYSKEYFARILKAEILLQQQVSNQRRSRKSQEYEAKRGLMADADLEREAKLEQSQKKYTQKKRTLQRKFIDEGNDIVGKKVIIFDEQNRRWRNVTVLDCMVKWVDNGLKANVTHLVQEYDGGYNKIGDEIVISLNSFKWFLSPTQKIDKDTIARWRERKRWDETLHEIKDKAEKVNKQMKISFDTYRRREERNFKRAKKRAWERFETSIEEEANEVAGSQVAKRALKALFDEVMLDIRKGIIDIDEEKSVNKQARAIAREKFVKNYVDTKRQELETQIEERRVEMKEIVLARQKEIKKTQQQILANADAEKRKLEGYIREQMKQRKEALLEKLKFPPQVFQLAAPKASNCEHLKTKMWGDNYGKGTRCMICMKELNKIEQEESQLLGYGSGADPVLCEAVKRHRDNEQSFRFKNSLEIVQVEEERRRLEKERRIMDENECYFYDYQDLKVIYDFDRRHAKNIKAAGIFRQGLQWSEDELKDFEDKKVLTEKYRLLEEGLPESLLEEFDALSAVAVPPPTFRAADERRKAQYNELVFNIGRLHNFRRKINNYKFIRIDLLNEQQLFSGVLETLHKDSYSFDHQLNEIEKDLDRTSRLLHTFESMQLLWQQGTMIQNQAKREKMRAEMRRVGVWDDVKECYDRTSFLRDETRELLKAKLVLDAKKMEATKSVEFTSITLQKAIDEYNKAEKLSRNLKYCKPGNLVYTKYGQCAVISYRQKDDMLLVNLPFCSPSAKAYIHYRDVVDFESARQQGERLLMGVEDDLVHRVVNAEKIIMKKERYQMQKEEDGLKRLYEFFDLGKNEDETMKAAIDHVVADRFEVTESKIYRNMQKDAIKQRINKVKADTLEKRKMYKGPPSGKPKAMSFGELRRLKKEAEVELKIKFIEQVSNYFASGY